MLIALTLLAAAPEPARTDHAWALGYTGFVTRSCDAWDQRTDVIPLADLPDAGSLRGQWGDKGDMTLAYRKGLAAARAARSADPRFCEEPVRRARPHAALVGRVLVRRADALDQPATGARRD